MLYLFFCPCLSVTVLKRACRNVGLDRWPARAISKQTITQVIKQVKQTIKAQFAQDAM